MKDRSTTDPSTDAGKCRLANLRDPHARSPPNSDAVPSANKRSHLAHNHPAACAGSQPVCVLQASGSPRRAPHGRRAKAMPTAWHIEPALPAASEVTLPSNSAPCSVDSAPALLPKADPRRPIDRACAEAFVWEDGSPEAKAKCSPTRPSEIFPRPAKWHHIEPLESNVA